MSTTKIVVDRLVRVVVEGPHDLKLEFPPKRPGEEPRRLPVHSGGSLVWPGVKLIIEEPSP